MELLSHLADGFATSLSPLNFFIVILGVTAGLFIGAMPGLGSVNGVAIVLPMTFIVPPSSAIILLAAIYYGAMNGGAISSILLGIPGASTAVATTFDGRPMAQQGKAGLALIAAATASFVGGTISVILFTLFAAPLADIALAFGPAEEFALVLLAFTTFVGLGGDDVLKTIIMICLGLALSTVGLDLILLGHQLPRAGNRRLWHWRNSLHHRDVEIRALRHSCAPDIQRLVARPQGDEQALENTVFRFADRFFRRHVAGSGCDSGSADVLWSVQADVKKA